MNKRILSSSYKIMLAALGLLLLFAWQPAWSAVPDILQPDNLATFGCAKPDTVYEFVKSTQALNVFYPGDPVIITLKVAPSAAAVQSLTFKVVEIGTRHDDYLPGFSQMTPPPKYDNLGQCGQVTQPVTIGTDPEGTEITTVALPVPSQYGTYLVEVAPDGKNPQFLCTVVRVHVPKPGFDVDMPIMADGGQFFGARRTGAALDEGAEAYERLGFKVLRVEAGWRESPDGVYDWSGTDELMNTLAAHHIKLNVTVGAEPQWSMPYGLRPGWDMSCAPTPEMYARFGRWVKAYCERYWKDGNGALWVLENWNEPWEPRGISGWGADSRQYRMIMKEIAINARAVDPRIKTAAACSIMNTEDKFLTGDNPANEIQYVDYFTDHYVGPSNCYGPMVAAYWGKESYETETWGAANELLIPQFVCTFLADGQRRVSPWNSEMAFFDVPGSRVHYQMPNPLVTASNAANVIIGARRFTRMLSLTHLPMAYQFGNDNDAVVILLNRLRNYGYKADLTATRGFLWSQYQSQLGGTLTIDNHDGALHFFDVDGNPEFVGKKSVTIPMDWMGHYITAPKGGALLIASRLNSAVIKGARPVEIIAHDFTTPLDDPKCTLRVTLHNLLDTPFRGILLVTAPKSITLAQTKTPVEIATGATVDFTIPVLKASPDKTNAYAFHFSVTGGKEHADWDETLSVLVIRRGTKKIDGNMDDWKDDYPVLVSSTLQKVDPLLRAWLPFDNLKDTEPDGSVGEVRMAWDDQNLYLAAQVTSDKPPTPHIRRATWDQDSYFFGSADDARCEALRPYRSVMGVNMRDPKVAAAMNANPLYQQYLQFLKDHSDIADLLRTNPQVANVYFQMKEKDPKASLASYSYEYARDFASDQPYAGDRFQFAFDAVPGYAGKHIVPDTDRVPDGYHAMPDTDYEFSEYPCTDGAAELWCLLAPGIPRSHYFPHQERSTVDQGPVPDSKQIVVHNGNTTVYQASIPWSAIKDLTPKVGQMFGFTFQLGASDGSSLNFGEGKSATKENGLTMHPYWSRKPGCGVQWALGN